MPKSRNKLVVLAVAGATVAGAWLVGARLMSDDDSGADSARHAVNQVWIERLPKDQRDMIGHFVLVKHSQGRIGVIGRSSQWRHFLEGFKWGLEGERLQVYLPQEDAKVSLRIRTWECDGEAPDPFELCMEIDTGKRKVKYYSRKDWVVEPHEAAASLDELAAEHPELAGLDVAAPALPVDGAVADIDSAIELDPELLFAGR